MRRTLLKTGIVTLHVVLLSGAESRAALASSGQKRLQVSGTAVVTASPDIAYITLGEETQDPSAEKAAQDNANIMARVMAALRRLGLTEKAESTSG